MPPNCRLCARDSNDRDYRTPRYSGPKVARTASYRGHPRAKLVKFEACVALALPVPIRLRWQWVAGADPSSRTTGQHPTPSHLGRTDVSLSLDPPTDLGVAGELRRGGDGGTRARGTRRSARPLH